MAQSQGNFHQKTNWAAIELLRVGTLVYVIVAAATMDGLAQELSPTPTPSFFQQTESSATSPGIAASIEATRRLGPGERAILGSGVRPQQSSGGERSTYKVLRYDEDYTYLRDPTQRTDFWDPIKYIALGSDPDYYLSFGGESFADGRKSRHRREEIIVGWSRGQWSRHRRCRRGKRSYGCEFSGGIGLPKAVCHTRNCKYRDSQRMSAKPCNLHQNDLSLSFESTVPARVQRAGCSSFEKRTGIRRNAESEHHRDAWSLQPNC